MIDEELEYQELINHSANILEKHLKDDFNRNLALLLKWLRKENPKFKPIKFKRELLNEIEMSFGEDIVDVSDNLYKKIKELQSDALEKGFSHNYLIITLYIFRHLIWYMYENGFQPSFTWELYRGLKLTESFYKKFEYIIDDFENKSQQMTELAMKRHEKSRAKDEALLVQIKEIWQGTNWDSYTKCADHIHKNSMVGDVKYRKIFTLVSKAAKQKN